MKLERWANWAEIAASVAVVASLLMLVQQVHYNTLMLERQIALDRAAAFNTPFLGDSPLPAVLMRIKAVDGRESVEEAFVQRYDLTYDNAVRWVRHLALVWTVMESDFETHGRSGPLDAVAWSLLGSPDNQLYWELGAPQVTDAEFRRYVTALRPKEASAALAPTRGGDDASGQARGPRPAADGRGGER